MEIVIVNEQYYEYQSIPFVKVISSPALILKKKNVEIKITVFVTNNK